MLIELSTGLSADSEARQTAYLDNEKTAAVFLRKEALKGSSRRKLKRLEGRRKVEVEPEKLEQYLEEALKEDSVYLEVIENRKTLSWYNLHTLEVLTEDSV